MPAFANAGQCQTVVVDFQLWIDFAEPVASRTAKIEVSIAVRFRFGDSIVIANVLVDNSNANVLRLFWVTGTEEFPLGFYRIRGSEKFRANQP